MGAGHKKETRGGILPLAKNRRECDRKMPGYYAPGGRSRDLAPYPQPGCLA
jgi:hypothetical protein